MADDEYIDTEASAGRIIVIEPNPRNNVTIPPEDLFIYVKLTADKRSRSVITIGAPETNDIGSIDSRKGETTNFLAGTEQNGQNFLTTDWTNMGGLGRFKGVDEAFGIENINIKISASLVPQVTIQFKDTRAAALFDALETKGVESKYDVFFSLPYPLFNLKVKGYYGDDVNLALHLVKWDSSFDEGTGSFKINSSFIGMTFAFLSDIKLGHVMGLVGTERGRECLDKVYDDYEASEPERNFFRLTLRELNQEIGNLKSILEGLKNTIIADSDYEKAIEEKSVLFLVAKRIGNPAGTTHKSQNLAGNMIKGEKQIVSQLAIRDIVFFTKSETNLKEIQKINSLISKLNKESGESWGEIEWEESKKSVYDYLISKGESKGTVIEGYDTLKESIESKEEFEKQYQVQLKPFSGQTYYVTKNSFQGLRKGIKDYIKLVNKEIDRREESIEEEVNKKFDEKMGPGGFKFKIRDVMNIVCANMEAFLLCLHNTSVAADKIAHDGDSRRESLTTDLTDIPNDPPQPIYPFPEVYKLNQKEEKYEEIYLATEVNDESVFPEISLVEDAIRGIINDKIASREAEARSTLIKGGSKLGNPYPVNTIENLNPYNAVASGTDIASGFIDNMWAILVERIMVAYDLSNYEHFVTEGVAGDAHNVVSKIKKSPKIARILQNSLNDTVITDKLDQLVKNGKLTKNGNNYSISIEDISILSDMANKNIDLDKGMISRNVLTGDFKPYDIVKKELNQEVDRSNYIPFSTGSTSCYIASVDDVAKEMVRKLSFKDVEAIIASLDNTENIQNAYDVINIIADKFTIKDVFKPYKSSIVEVPKAYLLFLGSHFSIPTDPTGVSTIDSNFFIQKIKNPETRLKITEYFNNWALDFATKFKGRFTGIAEVKEKANYVQLDAPDIIVKKSVINFEAIKSFLTDTIKVVIHDPSVFTNVSKKQTLIVSESTLKRGMSKFVKVLQDGNVLDPAKLEENIVSSAKKEQAVTDKDIHLSIYNHFKNIYDKWLAGSNNGNTSNGRVFNLGSNKRTHLKDYFFFVDRMWRNLDDTAVFNLQEYSNLTKRPTSNMLNFINDLIRESGFVSQMLPFFPDLSLEGAKKMFKPHITLNNLSDDPAFLCVYAKDDSKVLNTTTRVTQYVNDGYSFTDKKDQNYLQSAGESKSMVAFKVAFGQQNQSIFKGFSMSTSQFSETEESLRALSMMVDKTGPSQQQYKGGDLFPIHRLRSYEAKITSMGNMMITPMMYFNLENIPLFNGAHYIKEVEHSITPNNMVTTFTGVRQRTYSAPIPSDLTTFIKLDFNSILSQKNKELYADLESSDILKTAANTATNICSSSTMSNPQIKWPGVGGSKRVQKIAGIQALIAEAKNQGLTNKHSIIGMLGVIGKETHWIPKNEYSYGTTGIDRLRHLFSGYLKHLTNAQVEVLKKDDVAFYDVIYGHISAEKGYHSWNNPEDDPVLPGDGYKYRGRGFNGITFKQTYKKQQKVIAASGRFSDVSIITDPDKLNRLDVAAFIAVHFLIDRVKAGKFDPNQFQSSGDAVVAFARANHGWGNSISSTSTIRAINNSLTQSKNFCLG